MSLYRRLASIETREDIDRFAAELIDRFGPLPDEVGHLLEIVTIKQLAKQAGVEKIDAGPKGGHIGNPEESQQGTDDGYQLG
jgi:transcription-repair coupling factor (superfamily II helicase)